MLYILSPEQMRKADATAINHFGIPSIVLMENAARSASDYIKAIIKEKFDKVPTIAIICGSGNNGGDGYALARHLHEYYSVTVFWVGDSSRMSQETFSNFNAAGKIGLNVIHLSDNTKLHEINRNFDCIIDAMIGVGGSEEIRGITLEILKALSNSHALKIALDAPTGLNTQTGRANEHCFKADYTVTMFAIKTGMLIGEGMKFCGKVFLADLGAPKQTVLQFSDTYVLEENDLVDLLPRRERISSKFDYGRVIVVAGSNMYPGSAALVSNAAISAGAGLVTLYSTTFHSAILPEVIQRPVSPNNDGSLALDAVEEILEACGKADALAIGPGLGTNPETIETVKKILKNAPAKLKIIVDADGLKSIDSTFRLDERFLLTPHTGEFAAMTGMGRQFVEKDTYELAIQWSKLWNCNILLKHVPTIIHGTGKTFININGNPGMATAGSGDVLTGIISGFVAQGVDLLKAAAMGAYLHAAAGDYYIQNHNEATLTASELITSLKYIFPSK